MLPLTTLTECRHCGHPLRGRSDKKFCDDQCRNAFNNEQNSARNAMVRRVNAILLRNRRILSNMLGTSETTKVAREDLLLQGFQFRYNTHHYTNSRGAVYQFCYEYGWLQLHEERYLLVRRERFISAQG
ncbi:MAG: DUF2116 family Zn-ribbon domain-containing protein [Chitinophagaceae bacterium]|nr:MAG: DUF2116 family Zn-ribbon domain-containing protein [Chitinophagaceae bacterium]